MSELPMVAGGRMEVLIRPDNIDLKLDNIKNVKELIKKFGFQEEEVLVIDRDGKRLLTIDENLNQNQKIEIRKVVSGG